MVPQSAAEAGKFDHGKSRDFEVWVLDQSDTAAEGGGLLYIWPGRKISRNATRTKAEIIDLAQAATDAGCEVGKLPHMVFTNNTGAQDRVVIANFSSGSTFILDVRTREIVDCISTADAAGGVLNSHAAVPTPDDSMILVDTIGAAGQSGFFHKIAIRLLPQD